MAKRFIDTEFFKDVRNLDGPYKLFYIYIICDSDNAGFWHPDAQVAAIFTGFNITMEGIKKNFAGKYIELDNGQWFFSGFIRHQYPKGLQKNNPAHRKVIEKLSSFGLLDNNLRVKRPEGPLKVLESTSQGAKVMVMDKDKVKKRQKKLIETKIVLPWSSKTFAQAWERWRDYKQKQHSFKFKTDDSEQTALNDLKRDSGNNEEAAIRMIEKSIGKGWKGLFPLKAEDFQTIVKQPSAQVHQLIKTRDDDIIYLAERYCEGELDGRLINPELYDELTVRGFIQPGSLNHFTGTVEAQKLAAVNSWLTHYKNLKTGKLAK